MVQYNEDNMSRPSDYDSRPSTSGSGPVSSVRTNRWPGGARPKNFNFSSYSSGSRPSVFSRASGSLKSISRLGSKGSLLSGSGNTDDCESVSSRLRRELPSISDICGYDEVQDLLRDIESLECRRWNSDWETFTIQSSHRDLDFNQDIDYFGQDTEILSRCDSRLSWDSHCGRQPGDNSPHTSSGGSSPDRKKFSREPTPVVTLAWDDSHLKTSVGIFRLLLIVVSVITMTCACTVGTARLSIFVLPGFWRLRVMLFTATFAILTTTVLVFLHLSSLLHALIIRWDKLVTVTYIFVCVCYLVSSALLLHLLHIYHISYQWVPSWSKQQLLTTALCGCACGVIALVLAVISGFGWPRYSRVLSDGSIADPASYHQMQAFHRLDMSYSGIPVSDSRGLRDLTRTTLVHDISQQMTNTFTPDSLEEEPLPLIPLLNMNYNHALPNKISPQSLNHMQQNPV